MKKHRYSAKNIKQADWTQVSDQTTGRRIVFGVDVAKDDFFGVLMQEDLTVIATLKWVHPMQTRELGDHLIKDMQAERLDVVMEASGTYGDTLYRHLTHLGRTGIYRVSPKRVHDAAEVYDGVPSLHDAKSAYIIARLHLDGGSRVWAAIPEQRRNRQALIAELDLYQDQHQRDLNRLEALLNRHWPEVVRILDLKRVSLLALVAEHLPENTIHVFRQGDIHFPLRSPRDSRKVPRHPADGPWVNYPMQLIRCRLTDIPCDRFDLPLG